MEQELVPSFELVSGVASMKRDALEMRTRPNSATLVINVQFGLSGASGPHAQSHVAEVQSLELVNVSTASQAKLDVKVK